MKKVLFILLSIALFGCAKVNLQTSQPLKVDINMRVDVYQHVAKDVESIQDQIYGSTPKQINAIILIENAYAQEYSSQVTTAIENRKNRRITIEDYFSKGYIGETKDAHLAVRPSVPAQLRSTVESTVNDENNDRRVIYQSIADKNGADIAQTQKVFFDDDYKRAPAGSWFEMAGGWKQK
jgi:uncharacterized protein YdbL (DUF1318 family)